MGFRVVKDEVDLNRVEVADEPNWVVGMGPLCNGVSAELTEGVVLVVAFSIWSTPDRELAYDAIEIAKRLDLGVRIGLLAYDYPEELSSWLPNSKWEETSISVKDEANESVEITIGQSDGNSPVWFELKNGTPRLIGRGAISESDIRDVLHMLKAAATMDVTEGER